MGTAELMLNLPGDWMLPSWMTLQIDRGFYQKKYKNNERDFDAIAVDVLVDDLGDDLDGVAAVLLVLLEVDEPRRCEMPRIFCDLERKRFSFFAAR